MKIILILLFPAICFGQCFQEYDFDGPPGDIFTDSIYVASGMTLQIDFCTFNVPDRLEIESEHGSTLTFEIGRNIQLSALPPKYHGFCSFLYDNGNLWVLKNQNDTLPDNISCEVRNGYGPGGTLRLVYVVPDNQCILKWSVIGNATQMTVYHICIKVLDWGDPLLDTINYVTCIKNSTKSNLLKNCTLTTYIPVYFGIDDEPVIENPSCLGAKDGKIEFPKFPQYNVSNLTIGKYRFTVTNGICFREYIVELTYQNICKLYIPNVFKPNSDRNSQFIMFTSEPIEYLMNIYSRWGELVFSKWCVSNQTGWDGGNYQEGVFVYQIKVLNETFVGDVTLTR